MNKKIVIFILIAPFFSSIYGMHASDDKLIPTDAQTLSFRLSNNPDSNRQDANGNTLLHKVAEEGVTELIPLLIHHGANPNILNNEGDSPLQRAIENKHSQAASTLLSDIRTNPNTQNHNGDAPLHRAATHNLLVIVYALIARGANLNVCNADGDTPLHRAIENKNIPIAQTLLAKTDINVHIRNKYGDSPFDRAVFHGEQIIVDILLRYGINIDEQTKCGNIPLHTAIEAQQETMACQLAGIGSVEQKNNNGDTPLHLAAKVPNGRILSALLATTGIQRTINTQNNQGFTPLHNAVFCQQEHAVRTLLDVPGINLCIQRSGINKNFCRVPGKTPFAEALTCLPLNAGIIQLLAQKIDAIGINIPDETGKTPLMHAIRAYTENTEYLLPIIKTLLNAKNINREARDQEECTALQYAKQSPQAALLLPLFPSQR